ncbi:MAG: hypothetical protein ACK5RL_15065 [Acidimicrobiales bacterium]
MSRTTSHVTRQGLGRGLASSVGGSRLKVAPWHGRDDVVVVSPGRIGRRANRHDVRRCVQQLTHRGVSQAVTPALNLFEAEPFFQAGFILQEELHLLARPVVSTPPEPTRPLRRARPWDRRSVLAVDAKAFDAFWRFDAPALPEAKPQPLPLKPQAHPLTPHVPSRNPASCRAPLSGSISN